MSRLSMRDKILNYIVEHGSIDLDECWEVFHTQKLATRISELIDRGVPIQKDWVYKTLPNGWIAEKGRLVSRYFGRPV